MIMFLLVGLFGTGVFVAGLPILCFALMLETCERRTVELAANAGNVATRAFDSKPPIPRSASIGIPTVHGLQLS